MNKIRLVFLALTLMLAGASSANAHSSVDFSVNLGFPGYYAAPPPVYYSAPPVVYYSVQPQVYYSQPAVVYYQPAPAYYYGFQGNYRSGGHHDNGHHGGWGGHGWHH